MTGLECGHKFCVHCWSQYLTTKIMDEGMGQVGMGQVELQIVASCYDSDNDV